MAQVPLTTFTDVWGEVAIVPAAPGTFEIWLGGDYLHSRKRDGSVPELKPIKSLIRDRV